jgi:Plasmid pRiA4b ORF-3-like protein
MLGDELTALAASAPALRQVTALTQWVGAGRRLTQTGQLTMADARHLVSVLDTGDEIDPIIGEQVFRTRSSADLPVLTIMVTWAKAAGLVRVVHGRLVPVKKNQRLIDRQAQLWNVMFAAFDQLGPAICPAGWFQSLLGDSFADGIAVLFGGIADRGGAAPTGAVQEKVWSVLSARYYLDDATTEQLARLRKSTDHDVRRAVAGLVTLGALAEEEAAAGTLRLTPLAEWALRSRYGAVAPGDQIAQLKVTLLDTEPPVWRRLLVPATIRLDRLDRVIQAAMGWTNSHLHMFKHPSGRYGVPDLDFPLQDERRATLRDLVDREGETVGYEYDFGDGWEHEIVLEQLLVAEPGGQYPACLAGAGACPPEDCGGVHGFADIIDTLADPTHPEHQHVLEWLGIEKGSDFDPAHFDTADANRRLDTVILAATRTA